MDQDEERVGDDEEQGHEEAPRPPGPLQLAHAVVPSTDEALLAAGVRHKLKQPTEWSQPNLASPAPLPIESHCL